MVKRLAADRDWQRIVVVSWRYHLLRARYIFSRCEPVEGGTVEFVAVQRPYELSVVAMAVPVLLSGGQLR